MSYMEFAYGTFKKSDVVLQDGEDAYDAEERLNVELVDVDGQLYEFETSSDDLDAFGFSTVIEPSTEPRFMCMWYNGGAGIHEVVEEAIRKYIETSK